MKTTGEFVTHEYEITCEAMNKPVHLIPFGDIHRDAEMFASEEWKDFIKEYSARRDECYFIGMGDELDFMSTSERNAYQKAAYHESTTAKIEKAENEEWKRLAEEIQWMGDHLIGMHSGNHFFQFPDGTNSTQRICSYLGCKYLGCNSYVGLKVSTFNTSKWLYVKSYHGKGGGQLIGSPFNALQKTTLGWKADIVINGHDHSLGVLPDVYMEPIHRASGLDIEARRIMYVRSGSFLKGFEPGKKGYIADMDAKGKPLGVPEIHITPRRRKSRTNGKREYSLQLKGTA